MFRRACTNKGAANLSACSLTRIRLQTFRVGTSSGRREAGIQANPELGAERLVEPSHQVLDPGIGVLGVPDVALSPQVALHVAGFG